jgi:hypothetical protein
MAEGDFIKALYDQLNSNLELGDYAQFEKQLSSDDTYRKAIYDQASTELDLGDYNSFEGQVKKKSNPLLDIGQGTGLVSPEPQKESLTQPQPSVSKKDRNTTVIGDLGRTFSSTSKRMLGGIAGTPMLVNRTLATVTIRPILKAMGMSDEEASQATDQIIQSNTMGQMSGISTQAQKVLNKSAQRNEAKMTQIEGTIWDNLTKGKDGEKDLGAAFEQLGRGIVGFAPYSLMTMATAGAGTVPVLATVGATAASQQYSELEERKDLKEGTKVLNSWLYGGLEGLGEAASAVIFRGIGKLFKQAVAKKLPDNLIKSLAKGTAEAVGLESSSEVVTQIGQNLTDIMTGVDPERNVFDGVVDVALTSAGFGLVTGGMGGAGAAILGRTLASDKEVQQVQDNVQQEAVLIDQIEDTDSDPVKKALESRLKTLRYEADKIKDKNYELAKTLSTEQQQKVAELYSTWNELQGKINSGQLTEQEVTTLESAVEGIKSEIESVKEAQIEKLAEIKKKDAKFKIGDDTFETEGAVEAWLDKNYQKRGLPPIWHTPTEKVIDAWYKRNKEEIDKRELQPLFKTEEETKDAEGTGIKDQTLTTEGTPELVKGTEVFGKAEDVDKLTPSKDVLGNDILSAEEWNKLPQEEKENQGTITRPVTGKNGNTFNVDYGIAPYLQRIIDLGLSTGQSDSGMKSDHPRHRYVEGEKEGEIIDGGTYLTFWKPEATVVKETGRTINSQEDIDNIRKAAQEAGFIVYDGNVFFQPSIGINLPATKDGTWRQDILDETNRLTNERHPELGGIESGHPSGDTFMPWLDKRNGYVNEVVNKHGGNANFTDKQIAEMFDKFVSLLEKYKGGAKETLQSYLDTWVENTLKVKDNLVNEVKDDFDMVLQKLKNLGIIKTDCV